MSISRAIWLRASRWNDGRAVISQPPLDNWLALAAGLAIVIFLIFLAMRYPKKASNTVLDGSADEPYHVYTSEFDQEILAKDLVGMLPTASPDHHNGWSELSDRHWSGAISRSEHFYYMMRPYAEKLRGELANLVRPTPETTITIAVDQSGSMKGDRMAATVAAVRHVSDVQAALGIPVEILGFSTAGWRGGFARLKWVANGRPQRPGRLCALMHVIYKQPHEEGWSSDAWQAMLHPDILRENIDGEAVAWAADRLLKRSQSRRILLVVSDGAPVDDSTLHMNGPSYLERHLLSVIDEIQQGTEIMLGAVGVGYAVDRYYRSSAFTEDAAGVLAAITNVIVRLSSEQAD